ncbi:hypothetical protein ABT246_09500, partial [Streptomyces sp. NPDC001553]|uniref:hypothetical protein n=1 Tax=Streptomyces sp. NPDC001553 TaxID=3154385 RepID=UPI003320673A
ERRARRTARTTNGAHDERRARRTARTTNGAHDERRARRTEGTDAGKTLGVLRSPEELFSRD